MSLLQYAALAEQYTLTAADLARCASATRLSFLRSEDIGVAIVFSETRKVWECPNVYCDNRLGHMPRLLEP